jgi:hypothetical protein
MTFYFRLFSSSFEFTREELQTLPTLSSTRVEGVSTAATTRGVDRGYDEVAERKLRHAG